MKAVETIKDYRDIQKSVIFHKGETHPVSDERAKELIKAGVAKIIEPLKDK